MQMEVVQKHILRMTKDEVEQLRRELERLEDSQLGPRLKELYNLCRTYLV